MQEQRRGPGRGPGRRSDTKSFPLQLRSLPPALRPLARAYILGYASAVVPRLLTLILQHLSRRRSKNANCLPTDRDERTFAQSALHILRTGLEPQRFPSFCAVLVGGATLLQVRSRPPPPSQSPLPPPWPYPSPRPRLDLPSAAVEIAGSPPASALCGVADLPRHRVSHLVVRRRRLGATPSLLLFLAWPRLNSPPLPKLGC